MSAMTVDESSAERDSNSSTSGLPENGEPVPVVTNENAQLACDAALESPGPSWLGVPWPAAGASSKNEVERALAMVS